MLPESQRFLQDSDVIARHAERVLPPLASARLGDEYFYQSLPLCVIDAVYSIGVRYAGAENVVMNYCTAFQLPRFRLHGSGFPPIDQQESISEFIERLERLSTDKVAAQLFRNKCRTSPKNGILKADAVRRFAAVLRDHHVDHFQDAIRVAENDALERDLSMVPGHGALGIRVGYFWMLAGLDDVIKPDRWVLRFVGSCLNRSVNPAEARVLIRDATDRLKTSYSHLTPRLLDYVIWNFERDLARPRKAARCKRSGC